MDNKFGRKYELVIESRDIVTTITQPFTLEFDVTRSYLGSLNRATFKITNLAPATRNRLVKDFFNFDENRLVTFRAGYGDGPFTTVYRGAIFTAYSSRIGTNFVTEIVAMTGTAFISGIINTDVYPETMTDREVIVDLARKLSVATKLDVGYIGNFPNKSKRQRCFGESVSSLIQQISGNCLVIDNNTINVFGNRETRPTRDPIIIDSSMGLLGTPIRQNTTMVIPMLFAPEISPGYLVDIRSSTLESIGSNEKTRTTNQNGQKNYNGLQKVNSVHHSGTISGSICGNARTEVTVIFGVPAEEDR